MVFLNYTTKIKKHGSAYCLVIPADDFKKMNWRIGDYLKVRLEKDPEAGIKYD